ncbi:hypothetical protein H3018_gp24 [Bacillus phage DK3]|uniref:Uncharacterized protein n=2 Tax=Hemphillvirus TaxID=2842725 RepID=A0A3T0IIX0_9CAUD|nr:hypothetical protein H3017_gp22 [Bacillus phage DK2]YP_009910514.1 hypothetical protein H3018_gp24 [Bacillus phage DK3]AZU99775.1 hypothetical protein DK2_000022 [Bacillus phage DK2]AZU99822.1 hypothetical protein DK3_000024 [Bacillus phage DK3]
MTKEKLIKESIENWMNSVDVEDKEMFGSCIMEVKDVIDSYIDHIHTEQIKGIILKMNMLEAEIDSMYYDKTELAEKEMNENIKILREELGFDDNFMKLKIKW